MQGRDSWKFAVWRKLLTPSCDGGKADLNFERIITKMNLPWDIRAKFSFSFFSFHSFVPVRLYILTKCARVFISFNHVTNSIFVTTHLIFCNSILQIFPVCIAFIDHTCRSQYRACNSSISLFITTRRGWEGEATQSPAGTQTEVKKSRPDEGRHCVASTISWAEGRQGAAGLGCQYRCGCHCSRLAWLLTLSCTFINIFFSLVFGQARVPLMTTSFIYSLYL